MNAGERAKLEVQRAAQRAEDAERDLRQLADRMLEAGASPDLDCQEAVGEAASRLRVLSESTAR